MADPIRWEPYKDQSQSKEIEGEVVELNKGESEYGPFDIITLRQGDGELYSVAAFHTVLKRQVEEAGLEPGANIKVEYQGLKQGKVRAYHSYNLERFDTE